MELPYRRGGGDAVQARYHIIPDNVRGGWVVYATNDPQEPQQHFTSKEDAIDYAEKKSMTEGAGFVVENSEAPEKGI